MACSEEEVPPSFVCPITQEVMRDPVSTADGQSYEADAISAWLRTHDTSPVTNERLPSKRLTRNHALRNAIEEHAAMRKQGTRSPAPRRQSRPADAAKLILLGDSGVGKTSLVHRVKEGRFSDKPEATIGVSFCPHSVRLPAGRGTVLLHLWDTAGQEKYHAFTRSYFRGAAAAIVAYDITNRESYTGAQRWAAELTRECGGGAAPVVALVGSKSDLADTSRAVCRDEAEGAAAAQGMLFAEVSAKDGAGVDELFRTVAALIADRQGAARAVDRGLTLAAAHEPAHAGGCC